jgi:hypothetical protein
MMRQLLLVQIAVAVSLSSLHGQSASPAAPVARPEAIYTPMPVYRPEWAKQGLTGKGVVLVTIDKETGKVTGARCSRPPEANSLMALPFKRIHSGVSSLAP